MNSWGRSLGGVSAPRVRLREMMRPRHKLTHQRRKALDVDLLSDDEAAAALLARGLADDEDGVLCIGAQARHVVEVCAGRAQEVRRTLRCSRLIAAVQCV